MFFLGWLESRVCCSHHDQKSIYQSLWTRPHVHPLSPPLHHCRPSSGTIPFNRHLLVLCTLCIICLQKEIRVAKRTARRHFVSAHEKDWAFLLGQATWFRQRTDEEKNRRPIGPAERAGSRGTTAVPVDVIPTTSICSVALLELPRQYMAALLGLPRQQYIRQSGLFVGNRFELSTMRVWHTDLPTWQ